MNELYIVQDDVIAAIKIKTFICLVLRYSIKSNLAVIGKTHEVLVLNVYRKNT